MSDNQIVKSLALATWRGLALPPYVKVPLDVEHRTPERKYPYVNIAGHDYVGTDYGPFEVDCRFLNTLNQAPPDGYARWFPEYWEAFKATIEDGLPGDFLHPILGSVRCICKCWKTAADADVQSGIVVRVTWTLTNENPSTDQFFQVVSGNPVELAATADAAAAAVGVAVGLGQRNAQQFAGMYGTDPTQGLPTLSTIWVSISLSLFSYTLGSLTLLNSLLGDIEAMIVAITSLDDNLAFPALDALLAFRTYVDLARLNVAQGTRTISQRAVSQPTTLDAFARTVGNGVPDIMALNPTFLNHPRVPARSVLRYYST